MAGWPYHINQLAGHAGPGDKDGHSDDPWNDCGPASVSAIAKWWRGLDIEPDAIRDYLYGDGSRGYTYLRDLGRYVVDVLRCEIMWYLAPLAEDAAERVREALRLERPVLVVTREPAGYYHICPYTGFDEESVIRHQVLGGYRETLSWPEFRQRVEPSGWLMEIVTPK